MRNGKLRGLLITVMLLVFLAGLASILYPYIWGAAVDSSITNTAKDFLDRETPELPTTTVIIDSIEPEKVKPYPELWEDMVRYNQSIAAQGQSGLSCAYDYQKASFRLADYGLPDEIFGVLSIPAIDLEMPIYLGATEQHMADGAAHLSQTSLPIGGMDTNCVIAGHRGWRGADYFRHIDRLAVGDSVTLTNLWETLTYTVADIQIIQPHEVDKIEIQQGRDLLTLLTCHPYASGGRQRYVVYCERSELTTFPTS